MIRLVISITLIIIEFLRKLFKVNSIFLKIRSHQHFSLLDIMQDKTMNNLSSDFVNQIMNVCDDILKS